MKILIPEGGTKRIYFKTGLFLYLILSLTQNSYGVPYTSAPDTADFYSDSFVRNDNFVYQKYIQAVELSRVGFELADPIITLNSDEQFRAGFDDLQGSFKQYFYQVQHCDADWEKSAIWTNEYIEGIDEDQVENETRQEVDFTINTAGFRIDSPYQDIKVVILQNWRWDNALTTLKPYMVRNEVLDYNFDNGTNQFDGLNEFRRFDLKSMKFLSERVREITYDDTMFYAKLWDSPKRVYKEYTIDDDINGKFLLKTEDEPSVSNYGEYAYVKFFLPYEAPVVEGNLYVARGFNCWQYCPENKMQYNYRRKGYEASILFKQGYYNYLYVMLPNNSKTGDASWVEGNHSETRNGYTILVYHRSRGELYDELIATGSFESGKK